MTDIDGMIIADASVAGNGTSNEPNRFSSEYAQGMPLQGRAEVEAAGTVGTAATAGTEVTGNPASQKKYLRAGVSFEETQNTGTPEAAIMDKITPESIDLPTGWRYVALPPEDQQSQIVPGAYAGMENATYMRGQQAIGIDVDLNRNGFVDGNDAKCRYYLRWAIPEKVVKQLDKSQRTISGPIAIQDDRFQFHPTGDRYEVRAYSGNNAHLIGSISHYDRKTDSYIKTDNDLMFLFNSVDSKGPTYGRNNPGQLDWPRWTLDYAPEVMAQVQRASDK